MKRFTRIIDDIAEPSVTVFLTFREHLPPRVTIIALSFQVHKYYPSPYKFNKCLLGHSKNHCSSATATCRNCDENHNASDQCVQKCIICKSLTHTSHSKECSAYLELVNLIKYATDQDITVKEACFRISNTYSSRTMHDYLKKHWPGYPGLFKIALVAALKIALAGIVLYPGLFPAYLK